MTAFVTHGLYGRRLCLLAGIVGLLAGCTMLSHNSDATRSLSNSTEDQAVVLRNSHWLIEKIFQNKAIKGYPATLEFTETDHISGNSGCNVFHGAVAIDQNSISVGPLAGTRMACSDQLMAQEIHLYTAIDLAQQWAIDRQGRLHFVDVSGKTVLSASPAD
ncbi:MAG: hypothetical protein CMK60_06880 [Proteobacteria bacterium]|nr:hypothetical protein [Pseudomonadota bacterium]